MRKRIRLRAPNKVLGRDTRPVLISLASPKSAAQSKIRGRLLSRVAHRKLRLTGGEPLVRRGIMTLVDSLSRHLRSGERDELSLTTNGSQLDEFHPIWVAEGIRRIAVSLDTKATIRSIVPSIKTIGRKPKGHGSIIDRRHRRPAIARHMSVTGG